MDGKSRLQQDLEEEQQISRLLREMVRHIGKSRAIGMGELYEKVFERPWQHRINDTRPLRKLIKKLQEDRRNPLAICSSPEGYFLAAAGSELTDFIQGRLKKPALKKLTLAALLERKSLPDLLGQLQMEMRPGAGAESQ